MLLALLLATTGPFIAAPHPPRLPVFDAGPLFDAGHGCDLCDANFINHAWSTALIVAAGERVGGRRGLWWTVGGFTALKLAHESMFHNGRGPEVRADLASSLGTALLTAGVYEALHALGVVHWEEKP